jgi:cell division protease FtsH
MVFEEQSTGAANDIDRATGMARRMVTEFGMSRTLGPRAFGKKEELIFLGREISEQRNYSDEVAYQIDQEIRELIDAAHDRARAIVEEHTDKLQAIAELLLREETIEGEELEALFETPRPRPDLVGPPTGRPGRSFPPETAPAERPAARGERDLPPSPGQLRPQPAD